jgi:putative tricarboxylic transport membrane protein
MQVGHLFLKLFGGILYSMTENRKQILSGIFFIVFALVFYLESYNFHASRVDAVGPQFLPRLISICMLLLAFGTVVRGYLGLKKEHHGDTNNAVGLKAKFLLNIPLLLSVMLFMVYFFLVERGGYIIMTAVYIFFQTLLLLPPNLRTAKKHIVIIATIAVALPVGLYYLFSAVLMVFLPVGLIG